MNDILGVILFAGIPVISLDGLTRIGQNIIAMTQRIFSYAALVFIANLIFKICTTPIMLAAAVAAVNFAPNVIKWIWVKMGALIIDFCVSVFHIFAPATREIVQDSSELQQISRMYQAAQTSLPTTVNDMLCFLGVHELLGLIISYWIFRAILRIVLNIQTRVMTATPLPLGHFVG